MSFEIIVGSPITPKPDCERLQFTWNWIDYIAGYLTDKQLINHSLYKAFNIKKENTLSGGNGWKVTKAQSKKTSSGCGLAFTNRNKYNSA